MADVARGKMSLSEYKCMVGRDLRDGMSVEDITENLHLILENNYYDPPTYGEVEGFVKWVRRYEIACGRMKNGDNERHKIYKEKVAVFMMPAYVSRLWNWICDRDCRVIGISDCDCLDVGTQIDAWGTR